MYKEFFVENKDSIKKDKEFGQCQGPAGANAGFTSERSGYSRYFSFGHNIIKIKIKNTKYEWRMEIRFRSPLECKHRAVKMSFILHKIILILLRVRQQLPASRDTVSRGRQTQVHGLNKRHVCIFLLTHHLLLEDNACRQTHESDREDRVGAKKEIHSEFFFCQKTRERTKNKTLLILLLYFLESKRYAFISVKWKMLFTIWFPN